VKGITKCIQDIGLLSASVTEKLLAVACQCILD
jgi:hypothetical protein